MHYLLWCLIALSDGFPPTQVTLPSRVTLPQVTLPERGLVKSAPRPGPRPALKVVKPVKREPQHSHKCGRCGHVWTHGESSFGNAKAHTCPKCGSGPWWTQLSGSRRISAAPRPMGRANCPT
jgi:DNA-directed RNA polymerase subunit RPC12/RpoP